MELTENSTWILSALELNLCLNMLGVGQRSVLPVAVSDLPLNRRLLNSFVYLMELGLVKPDGAGFTPVDMMRSRLQPVAFPRRILRLSCGKESICAAYFNHNSTTLAEVMSEDGQSCRISAVSRNKLARELERLIESHERKNIELELLNQDGFLLIRKSLSSSPECRLKELASVIETLDFQDR